MSSVNYYIEKLEKITAKKVLLEDFSKADVLIDKIRKELGIEHKMSAGMCGVVSVLLWDALGSPKDLRPVYGFLFGDSDKGFPHVFLYNDKTHEYIDPTADQFLDLNKEVPVHGILKLTDPENYHYELRPLSDREIEGIKWEHDLDLEWKRNYKEKK